LHYFEIGVVKTSDVFFAEISLIILSVLTIYAKLYYFGYNYPNVRYPDVFLTRKDRYCSDHLHPRSVCLHSQLVLGNPKTVT
jgi:hypothetical protein